MKKIWSDERGLSFLLVFLTIILVSVLGISLLSVSSNSLKISSHEKEDQSIYYIAEGGLNYVKFHFKNAIETAYADAVTACTSYSNPIPRNFEDILNDTLDATIIAVPVPVPLRPTIPIPAPGIKEITLDTKSINSNLFDKQTATTPYANIIIQRTSNNLIKLEYSIKSTGILDSSANKISRTLNQDILYTIPSGIICSDSTTGGNFYPQNFTVQTKGNILLDGSGKIVGAATNETGTITVKGGSTITGEIGTYIDNFKPEHSGLYYMKNQVTNHTSFPPGDILGPFPTQKMKDLAKLNFPPNVETGPDQWNRTLVINNGDFLATDYKTNNYTLNLTGDTRFNLFKVDRNNTIFINVGNSDKDLYINDLDIIQGHIKIIGTGKLNIYINNNMYIKGSFNSGGDISKVYFAYNGTSPLTFKGETKISGSLYANNANLTFTDGVGVNGNIYTGGSSIIFNGGFNSNGQHILAPNASVIIDKGAHLQGALVANNLIIDGGASITYAESIIPGAPSIPSISFPTEDNIIEIDKP